MAKYIVGRQSQNRNKSYRYCAVIGIYLFLMTIVQTSLLSRIKPFGGVPDLILISVMGISLYCGCYAGAVTGICAGFLSDALGSMGISILPLVFLLVGYLFGYYARLFGGQGFLTYLIGVGISLVVRFATTLILTFFSVEQFRFSVFLLKTALPELLGTAIFSLVLFFPILGICKWLKRRD